jgi:endonuclease VIII
LPEGDTIFRAARTLNRALAGQTITRFETGLAELSQIDRDEPIAGRAVERVHAAGKHLLITLSGNLTLRTHMRMNGSWHVYRPGEAWQLPRRAMRIVIETADWVAVAFNVYDAEFVPTAKLARHQQVATLGPDLLGDFDIDRALALVRLTGATPIRDVLLNQRVLAGLGNVYKSEILFLCSIHPDTPSDAVSVDEWRSLMALAQKLLNANVADASGAQIVTYSGLRRTTGRMNQSDRLWVYGRRGQPCRKCGTPIASRKDGDDARVTYWCPSCQAPRKHGITEV